MPKQSLIDQILTQLQQALDVALLAADEAHQNATHAESAAETQYDTLGLENAYLAHGQSMRVEALQQAIISYEHLPLRTFDEDDEIGLGALVEVESSRGDIRRFLLGPQQGGLTLSSTTGPVTLITPQTPVGQRLMGLYLDDSVELPGANGPESFTISGLS